MAKILIVDDDSAVQLTMLERAGHSLVAASDGRKGMALFDEGDFGLLFPDIFMPGMDGFETMRLVHQQTPQKPNGADHRQAGSPAMLLPGRDAH